MECTTLCKGGQHSVSRMQKPQIKGDRMIKSTWVEMKEHQNHLTAEVGEGGDEV